MKTFAVTLSVDARIVVTDEFVKNLRIAARGEVVDLVNPTPDPFLAKMNADHIDDDEFVKAVLANGIRKMTRASLVDNLHHSGVSATVAPASVDFTSIPAVEEAIAEKVAKTEEAQQEAALVALLPPELTAEEVAAIAS